MDDVLVDLARENVDLNFGVFPSQMVGGTAAASTIPLLQLWIPSDFVSHDDSARFGSARTWNHIARLPLSNDRTQFGDAVNDLVECCGSIFRHCSECSFLHGNVLLASENSAANLLAGWAERVS
jgi:hypothetical protein